MRKRERVVKLGLLFKDFAVTLLHPFWTKVGPETIKYYVLVCFEAAINSLDLSPGLANFVSTGCPFYGLMLWLHYIQACQGRGRLPAA